MLTHFQYDIEFALKLLHT